MVGSIELLANYFSIFHALVIPIVNSYHMEQHYTETFVYVPNFRYVLTTVDGMLEKISNVFRRFLYNIVQTVQKATGQKHRTIQYMSNTTTVLNYL
jgi:hypothetical protein